MRYNFGTLLILSLLSASQVFAGKRELRVAVYEIPPHVFVNKENSALDGSAIDFFNLYMDPQHKYEVKWMVTPFARFLSDLENKKIDVGLLLAKNPEREKLIRYSVRSLYTTSSGVIVPKNFFLKELKTLKDLKGLTLGHSQASISPPVLIQAGVKFDYLSGEDVIKRNIERTRLKRIDGVFVPTYSNAEYVLNHGKYMTDMRLLKIPESNLELYVVFRKNIDEETFKYLSEQISKHRSSYPALVKKYVEASAVNKAF